MSMKKNAFIFGYGKKGRAIAHGLKDEDLRLYVIESLEANYQQAKEDGYLDLLLIDMTKDEDLERLDVMEDDYIICVMDDEHLNVFLTLSLHALYPTTTILGISDSIHVSQKLKMAGATKVIDMYQMSANRVHNILTKPIATKLLEEFIIRDDGISLQEIRIPENSYLNGMSVDEVDFQAFGVIMIGMIDVELSHKFIFITTGVNHKLDSGDILVCIGEKKDLKKFERYIARSKV